MSFTEAELSIALAAVAGVGFGIILTTIFWATVCKRHDDECEKAEMWINRGHAYRLVRQPPWDHLAKGEQK